MIEAQVNESASYNLQKSVKLRVGIYSLSEIPMAANGVNEGLSAMSRINAGGRILALDSVYGELPSL